MPSVTSVAAKFLPSTLLKTALRSNPTAVSYNASAIKNNQRHE
jgi:hypothetical protein